jgi:hypothetical protein
MNPTARNTRPLPPMVLTYNGIMMFRKAAPVPSISIPVVAKKINLNIIISGW